MRKPIMFGFSYEGLKKLGIHHSYEDLVDLENRGRFPKQVEPRVWIAQEVLEWLLVNIDRLPPKLD
ncbi:hypothetical protein K3757_13935 [Sulfitobacter sp. S223]|uniref:hypothetical protein n=1 Tax=Sulfitobacter sp. S223 TaxID=2867023 RepID=UPI0021A50FD6|nr:hypothetical protein [Sulfitobacter sp. S223]UWR25550.1 hypothetical protein K3757_13935 [Sulfitobacter sp. S223]